MQKVKLKVGKTKAKADNFTDTSFKSKCALSTLELSIPRSFQTIADIEIYSDRRKPAIPHHFSTIHSRPIQTLSLPRNHLEIRPAEERCPRLPYQIHLLPARRPAPPAIHRCHTPTPTPTNARWLSISTNTPPTSPPTPPQNRHRRPSRSHATLRASRHDESRNIHTR